MASGSDTLTPAEAIPHQFLRRVSEMQYTADAVCLLPHRLLVDHAEARTHHSSDDEDDPYFTSTG